MYFRESSDRFSVNESPLGAQLRGSCAPQALSVGRSVGRSVGQKVSRSVQEWKFLELRHPPSSVAMVGSIALLLCAAVDRE
jgi:hypothetical protein